MTIDDVKKYWNNRPCNIAHSDKKVGSPEYFEEVTKRKYFVEPHIPAFANFEQWCGMDVLELGCGIGTDAAEFVYSGARYTGVDVSSVSILIANNRLWQMGEAFDWILVQSNIETVSNLFNMRKKFDLVYSFGVIHHTPNPEKAVKTVKGLLKGHGEFRLMLYSKYSIKNLLITLGLAQHEAQAGCPIARTYSYNDIMNLLKDFEIISIKKAHIFRWRLEDYKKYRYVEAFPWKWIPTRLFNWLESKLGWHTLVVCRLKGY